MNICYTLNATLSAEDNGVQEGHSLGSPGCSRSIGKTEKHLMPTYTLEVWARGPKDKEGATENQDGFKVYGGI